VHEIHCAPFFRWVGSKRRLLPELISRLPEDYRARRHIEPFVGGGALFFALAPERALLADLNADLINAYLHVGREHLLEKLLAQLTWLEAEHSEENYYEVRTVYNSERDVVGSPLERPDFGTIRPRWSALRAAVFLYLISTNFNGLYRENRLGAFNVPVGDRKNPDIRNEKALRRCHVLLNQPQVEIKCQDFTYPMTAAMPDDFFYIDPPYDSSEDAATPSFTSYSAEGFGDEQQVKLRDRVVFATARGAKVMLSNHDTPFVRELYKDFLIEAISGPRSVGAKTRASAEEVIVRNYER
jgi:DNA adenine methylase